ncbi:MAG: hypothetical protein J6A52_07850 [Bacilli bacterium]|nr:hypothetical protein [Bacilli bacterium]
MNIRDKKNIMIVAMLIAITFMSAGYVLLSEQLDVRNAITSVNPVWDVKILSISSIETEGYAQSIQESIENKYVVNFNSEFQTNGDKITYVINVRNEGTLAAKLSSIIINPKYENEYLTYTVEGIEVGDKLNIGESKMFTFTIEYNNEIDTLVDETIIDEVKLTLDYTK